MIDPTEHVVEALSPRSPRERVRILLSRGFTAVQVYERLPEEVRDALAGDLEEPNARVRRGIDRVHRALLGLVEVGRVKRRRERYAMFVNTKGERGMLVDVYRLV